MIEDLRFYIRLDYRAVYIGYLYSDNEGREIHYSPSGYEFMQSTIAFIGEEHNILVGRWTVEKIFRTPDDSVVKNDCIEIRGRNLSTGLPDKVCVSLQAINENLTPSIKGTATNIALNLENVFPDAIYDVLLKSEFVLQEGDFPLPANFMRIYEQQLPVPITAMDT